MRTHNELKQLLIQIKNSDYTIPSEANLDDLIADMLKHIGHTDPMLRDELIYSTVNTWIDKSIISTIQMKHILTTCLDKDHLFYGIGESDTDSVFTRAFSSLQIAAALWMHDESPFLTSEDILNVKDTVLSYVSQERDYRGYVTGKGWAHAVAHIADTLANIAVADKVVGGEFSHNRETLLELLNAAKTLICNKDCVYTAEEDERLTHVIFGVCSNEVLSTKEIIDWLKSFNMASFDWKTSTVPDDYYAHVNHKHFMRSLYFGLMSCKEDEFDEISPKEICEYMLEFLVDAE